MSEAIKMDQMTPASRFFDAADVAPGVGSEPTAGGNYTEQLVSPDTVSYGPGFAGSLRDNNAMIRSAGVDGVALAGGARRRQKKRRRSSKRGRLSLRKRRRSRRSRRRQ